MKSLTSNYTDITQNIIIGKLYNTQWAPLCNTTGGTSTPTELGPRLINCIKYNLLVKLCIESYKIVNICPHITHKALDIEC